jgi:carboxypeptidase family protein
VRPTDSLRALAVSGLLMTAASGFARAQATPRPQGPGTIAGVATDSGGVPLDSVDLSIAALKRRVVSGSDGAFRFDKLAPGRYDVAARRIGYLPQVHRVVVGEGGGVVRFLLVPAPRTLPPVVTAAVRGGLSGAVGDTAYNIIAGAEISVVATDHRTTSDSAGAFFLPLHTGKYMVRVTRPGFEARLFSVTIPNDSGRRVLIWMMPTTRGAAAVEAYRLDALRDRLERRKATSTILTREDISRLNKYDLGDLVRFGSSTPIDESCLAVIDGGPRTMPIWNVLAADIETVEIYPPGTLPLPDQWTPRSQPSGGIATLPRARQISSASGDCTTRVFVWLRK